MIDGTNSEIKICSHINNLLISGYNNDIDGTDPNCKIEKLEVKGSNNTVKLNRNCSNVQKNIASSNELIIEGFNGNNGINNFNQAMDTFNYFTMNSTNGFTINITNTVGGVNVTSNMNIMSNTNNMNNMNNMNNNMYNNMNNPMNNNMNSYIRNLFNNMNNNMYNNNMNNNSNMNNNMYNNNMNNNRNITINFYNNNMNSNINNRNMNNNIYNNNMNNNSNMNNNFNNNNMNNNSNNRENNRTNLRDIKNSIMASVNMNNLSDFEKKKLELTLEMDEYQYKHIQKYESRKETKCAICLEDFKGPDIIKAFYKCEHIFHKKCLLDWLKKNNKCPLCNHDLSDDIKKMK